MTTTINHTANTTQPPKRLVKKLETSQRLANHLLARLPTFKAVAGALADTLNTVTLSTGETALLQLPHHTHLNPNDLLLDEQGMMVRVAAAPQAVLAIRHPDIKPLVSVALMAQKQGRALGWQGTSLLLADEQGLADYLTHASFLFEKTEGVLDGMSGLEGVLAPLPLPEHACGHAHQTPKQQDRHAHAHAHAHAHEHGNHHLAH